MFLVYSFIFNQPAFIDFQNKISFISLLQMERTTFLKFIQQKNDHSDLRKMSLQSISSLNHQKNDKGIFHFQSPAFHSQLPAFVNRNVKNLKPYTNHFKRFNIQTTNISQSPQKGNQANKIFGNNIQSEKAKIAKSNLLKQLGIAQQIKPTDSILKVPQICVYQQFLQKTNTILTSSMIDTMYKNCLKKNLKLHKQTYQRSHRQTNPNSDDKCIIPKQQRRSLGQNSVSDKQQDLGNKNSKKSIKSLNQLIKFDDGFLKSQKVCIIPNLVNLQHEDIFCKKSNKNIISMKKKYTMQSNDSSRNQKSITSGNQSNAPTNQFKNSDKDFVQRIIITHPKNQQKTKKQYQILSCNTQINDKKQQYSSAQLSKKVIKKNSDLLSKQSPKKYHPQKGFFNFNIGIGIKTKENLKTSSTPIEKNHKKDATINANKIKNISSNNQVPFPSNVTAFSYIIYEPSFSQNCKFKEQEQNLKNTNKIFGNNRVLASLNCKSVVQIASLTKIMTFLLALEICQKFKINSTIEKVRVGKFEASINGTSAEIKEGQIYTVQQLYYGLMLPSGNDASLALAIWGGKKMLIYEIKEKQKQKSKRTDTVLPKSLIQNQISDINMKLDQKKIVLKKKKCYERFILQMNKKARELGMMKTNYANSHGLTNNLNKSCAFDLCILCEYAMMNEKFKKVVSSLEYRSTIQFEQLVQGLQTQQNEQKHHIKVEQYENNNQNCLLDDIQHDNQHSDEQSTESMDDKQEFNQKWVLSERQKRFLSSQSKLCINKQNQNAKSQITYGQRQVYWQNTHKLLSKSQYIGIKTGITNTAGPCLASCIKTSENRCFIIIVLNSKKLNYRFKDTEILRKWVYKKQKLVLKQKQSEQLNQQNAQQQQDIQTNLYIDETDKLAKPLEAEQQI